LSSARSPTVLVADDQTPLRALVRATLGSSYRLLEAKDGEEALSLVQAEQPDLVLLDVNMPKVDGIEVCRGIKAEPRLRETVVLMLTALSEEADRRNATAAGADGYLTKPFSPSALLSAIEDRLFGATLPAPPPPTSPEQPLAAPPNPNDIAQMLLYAHELNALHEAARHQAAHFRRLVEIGKELVGVADGATLARTAVERATSFSECEHAQLRLAARPGDPLELRAAVGVKPAALADPRAVDALAEQAVATGRPQVMRESGRVESAEEPFDRPDSIVALALPLLTPTGRSTGVLLLASGGRLRRLDDHELDALQLLAAQIAAAVENSLLYLELADRERRLHDLVGRLLVAQEEERKVVAYEVHDGLAQVAAASLQHLQAFAARYHTNSPQRQQALDRTLELARRTVREARHVIANLRSTVLDDFGLATAIRMEIDELKSEGWDIEYDEALGAIRLPPLVETALLRVAQEALSNIRKHAGTTRTKVTLARRGNVVEMEIRDWGRGFRPDRQPQPAGRGERVGLTSMRERVALLGGKFGLESQPGEGTRVCVQVRIGERGE
jgi:signal transduction histidine kinase